MYHVCICSGVNLNPDVYKRQCMDIVEKLPDGIDTVIGTKGIYLSGGEQQRIAIARVMLKNSPIVILDRCV